MPHNHVLEYIQHRPGRINGFCDTHHPVQYTPTATSVRDGIRILLAVSNKISLLLITLSTLNTDGERRRL